MYINKVRFCMQINRKICFQRQLEYSANAEMQCIDVAKKKENEHSGSHHTIEIITSHRLNRLNALYIAL